MVYLNIFKSRFLKEWYLKLNLNAVIADVLILVIGFPFRIFSKLPAITQSVIHSPYSFCVETLSLIESKIDLIFNTMAALFFLISIFYIFHLIF